MARTERTFGRRVAAAAAFISFTAFVSTGLGTALALADPLALAEPMRHPGAPFNEVLRDQAPVYDVDGQNPVDIPAELRRQVVEYPTAEAPGTIVIDTAHTYLYFVLGRGQAMRYGIGVGRDGFTWSGIEFVARKAEWPDWYPPSEMLARQPYLARVMAGGPGNPLGARAMYLGHTEYRIHGTNQPSTIGKHVSSGCIRLLNSDVIDLYGRVGVGAKVVVLPASSRPDQALPASPRPRQAAVVRVRSAPGTASAATPRASTDVTGSLASPIRGHGIY